VLDNNDDTWQHEALGLWCDYLLAALPSLVRLDLRTWDGNERMVSLAKRLGFREEARFRRARMVKGERCDGLGFGVLREEWYGMFPGGFSNRPEPLQLAAPADRPPFNRNVASDGAGR
jgi:hypothetical protein